MSRLAELIEAAHPALAAYAVAEPGPGRFGESDGGRGFVLEAVYEGYLMHYAEARAFTGMDDCLQAMPCTRSAWRASRKAATWRPWPSCRI